MCNIVRCKGDTKQGAKCANLFQKKRKERRIRLIMMIKCMEGEEDMRVNTANSLSGLSFSGEEGWMEISFFCRQTQGEATHRHRQGRGKEGEGAKFHSRKT